jgi:tRNA (adenine57-N1/adenine58-N1)-methyltransferase
MSSTVAAVNDTVMLISEDGKRFYTQLQVDRRQHTHQGIIDHNDLIGQPLGRKIRSTTGHTYLALEPSLAELMKGVKRKTQIIYPKEAGRIIFKLNIYSGRRVIEAGTGSGSLTLALARLVAPGGKVYSYVARPDIQDNARDNLARANLLDFVELRNQNIADGFEETGVDALFLDVKEPWRYLPQAKGALKIGGFFGAILPTTNQVTELLIALKMNDFDGIEVEENFLRGYKPVPGRLRPQDIMVGHTGYLIFARNIVMDIQESARQKKINWQASQESVELSEDAAVTPRSDPQT